ncbi:maleylpyruvate isomerase N-terminal domain-containing protein [Ilumatobacter sp.]|uniref:maleylpyruvate isomerase N-terminal domain-containing protein n=1 Tax=Ilumatobacter sp. TaxID=1967498 RepID=UPI003B526801
MSRPALESLTRSVDEVKQVITSLTPEEWAMRSGCDGWTVKDLVAHMSSNYKEVVEPSDPPAEPVDLPAERMMDLLVAPRTDWTNEQVRDEYLEYCDGALAAMGALQEEPAASTVIALADLGSYPMNQLADAYAFDHYCHLRIDLLAPDGPIRRELPPTDDDQLGPAVGWMLTGLPQMQPGLVDQLSGRLRLELTGPGGGAWDLVRGGDDIVVEAPDGDADATVTSSAHDFVLWGTVRTPWRESCTVTGDEAMAATFLDALNIV